MLQLILDIETKKTFEEVGGYFPEKLEVSFVGVCARQCGTGSGTMLGFFERNFKERFELMEKADVVIGYVPHSHARRDESH